MISVKEYGIVPEKLVGRACFVESTYQEKPDAEVRKMYHKGIIHSVDDTKVEIRVWSPFSGNSIEHRQHHEVYIL